MNVTPQLVEARGVEPLFHSLRRTATTLLHEAGVWGRPDLSEAVSSQARRRTYRSGIAHLAADRIWPVHDDDYPLARKLTRNLPAVPERSIAKLGYICYQTLLGDCAYLGSNRDPKNEG